MFKWFKRKYNYHVTFIYLSDSGGMCFSDIGIESTDRLKYKNDGIGRLKKYLQDSQKLKDVVILNIVRT